MIVLGVETSCDETGVGIINDEEILTNVVRNQLIHSTYGGVVPELAARDHIRNIVLVLNYALKKTNIPISKIELLSYTRGPGLLGALLVGSTFTKALGLSTGIPTIGVSHIESHIYSLYPNLKYPILILLISGGHTELIYVKREYEYDHIGTTLDDACGEAFDKVARILGLSYPGGPQIEELAQKGSYNNVSLPKPKTKGFDFSFSGLKTSVLYYLRDYPETKKADIAASFQKVVIEYLFEKTLKAAKEVDVHAIGVVGGVSANMKLREKFQNRSDYEIFFPDKLISTDNGIMVAFCGLRRYKKFGPSPLNTKIFATKKGLF